MAAASHPSRFLVELPDPRKLCCVTVSLQEKEEEPRSRQIQTCRELVLMYSDLVAAPALDSFTEFTVVMAIQFFQKGVLQAFGWRRHLLMGPPERVHSGVLQRCVSFSLNSRLSPSWNKVGRLLVHRSDFLSESGTLDAVSLNLSTTERQLCVTVEVSTVILPPATLQDLELPPPVLRRFCSDPASVLDSASLGGPVWCHVLPSMKKGQIVSISRQLPQHAPFRSYTELREHWNLMYGYQLPELAEEELVYCTLYFRPVGDKLFSYPLSCIRLQPERLSRGADLRGALCAFVSDLQRTLRSLCGFPVRLSAHPSCSSALPLNTATPAQHNEWKSPALGGEMAKWAGLPMSPASYKSASPPQKAGDLSPSPSLSQPAPVRLLPASQLAALAPPPQQELSAVGCGSQGSPASVPGAAPGGPRARLTLPAVRKAPPSSSSSSSFCTPPPPVIPRFTSSPTFPPLEAPPPSVTSWEASGCTKGGDGGELRDRRRQTNRHDVEEAARNNQLSRLSSVTLLSWLRGRGEAVSAKHRKEELILKVIQCLAEV